MGCDIKNVMPPRIAENIGSRCALEGGEGPIIATATTTAIVATALT